MPDSALNFTHRYPGLTLKAVLLCVVAGSFIVADGQLHFLQTAKSTVHNIIYPLQWLTSKPSQWLHTQAGWFEEQSRLITENNHLRVENQRLAAQAMQLDNAQKELNQLRGLHRLKTTTLNPLGSATVISNGKGTDTDTLTLDHGRDIGVQGGEAVVTAQGLIGQITGVQAGSAQVALLSHRNSVIPVMVARNGSKTLLYGDGSRLTLRYFPSNADLKAGDLLVTSGLDSVYPPGIPVAKVSAVARAEGTPYFKVDTEPAASADSVRYVTVLPLYRPDAVALIEAAKPKPEAAPKSKGKSKTASKPKK